MKTTKISFIVNPVTGKNKTGRLKKNIQDTFIHEENDIKIQYTEYAGHAREIARADLKEGFTTLVAVGGDGTVNEVGQALRHKKAVLGIIPTGSGNGLARHLEIPMKIQDALEVLKQGKAKKIDYGIMNNIPFFCTCGVGFDARIGNEFASSRRRGFYSYVKTTIKEFNSYKPQKYKLRLDEIKTKKRAFLVTVANAAQYGNNAYISPDADIQDGLLNVHILSPFPKYKVPELALRLFNRSINKSIYVKSYKAKKISIKRKKKGEVHYDGEPVIMGKKIAIEVVHKGLKVIIPGN